MSDNTETEQVDDAKPETDEPKPGMESESSANVVPESVQKAIPNE
jgi:hypothetical protein